MYSYRIEWMGRVYSGHGYQTPEAALRAKIEKISQLARSAPKRRTVQVRAE
jgi:hypothetical protein